MYDDDELTPHASMEMIRQGSLALSRIIKRAQRTFPDWIVVSDGLRQGMKAVAKELGWNSPDSESTIFNRAFKDWRVKNKYGSLDQVPGGKVTLSRLLWLTDPKRREAILAWFNNLLPGQQMRLHSPDSVYNRYRKEMFERERTEPEPKPEPDDVDGDDAIDSNQIEPLVTPRPPLSPLPEVLPLADNDEIAAMAFFDFYGDRADAILRAIHKIRRMRRRAESNTFLGAAPRDAWPTY